MTHHFSESEIATRQPKATLFGGPYDGLSVAMTGFWSEKHALAFDVLVTPQKTVVPFWNKHDLKRPAAAITLHHYTLHEGKYYQYNYAGIWEWPDER